MNENDFDNKQIADNNNLSCVHRLHSLGSFNLKGATSAQELPKYPQVLKCGNAESQKAVHHLWRYLLFRCQLAFREMMWNL